MKKTDFRTIGYGVLKGAAQFLAALGFLLGVWVVAYFATGNELIVPSVFDCVKEMGNLLGDGWFWECFWQSFSRVVFAFLLSFVCAAAFAVLAYTLPIVRNLLAPVVAAFRSLPILAVTLILLIVFGAGGAPIAVAFLSLFPMLYTAILAALLGIGQEIIDADKVFGASLKNKVFRVYLPLVSPYVLREATAAFSFSLKLVVSAEVVANTARSLGGMMQEAQAYADGLPKLFALVIVTFIVALILEVVGGFIADRVEKKVK